MKQKSFTPTESGNGPSPSGGIWTILSRQATAIWIFAILISVLVFGLIQPPWPDPTNPPAAFRSIDWWRYPIERNREMKLPYLQGTLTNIAAPRDSADVWIAGADTLIHSPDNGKTWEQLPVPDPPIASEEKRISGTSSGDSSDPKSDMAQRPVKPSDPRALAPELRFSVESIDFLDDKIGWITIHNRAENTVHLYRTADAGATWDGPYEFPEPLMEWNPRFVTADEGVTQADEDIYYTDDGGNTWSMVYDADLENPGGRYN